MPNAAVMQSSFRGGEWSPLAQGRAFDPNYSKAMAVCVNGIPLEEDAWTRRGGFLRCGATRSGEQGIIRPFLLPNSQPCYMEFTYTGGTSSVQFWVASGSTFVRLVSDTRTISAISAANPAQFTVTASETWSTGDRVVANFASSTIAPYFSLAGQREMAITVVDGTHFTVKDAVTNTNINGSGLSYSSSGSDTVSKVLTISLPYTTLAAVQAVRVVKADNLAILLSPGYNPQALYYNGSTFTLTQIDETTLDGPYLAPLVGAGLSQQGVSSGHVNADWVSSPTTFAIDDGAYTFSANDVGKSLRLFVQPPAWNASTPYAANQASTGIVQYVSYNGSYWWMADDGAASSNVGRPPAGTIPGQTWIAANGTSHIPWIPIEGGGNWLTAKIVGPVTGGGTTVGISLTSPNSNPNNNSQWVWPPGGTYHTADMWQLSLFGTNAQPTCGAYREGRLFLGGAQLNRFDTSTSDALDAFAVQQASGTIPVDAFSPTDRNGNVGDGNAIAAVMNDTELNSALWFAPIKNGTVCGTPGGEFFIDTSNINDGLTPATTKANKVSEFKCANAEPLHIGSVLVIVQALGKTVLEYFSDAFSGDPVGLPLNDLARGLAVPGIAEIRYQTERPPIIWARRNDNALIGCTYRRKSKFASQPPEICAWHEHSHGGGYAIESICVGPAPNGLIDCLVAIVNAGGVRQVEFMTPIFEETYQIPQAMHFDGATIPTGSDAPGSGITLYGLTHYAGLTVTVWLAGLNCGNYTVSAGGTVLVPYQSDPAQALTAAYLTSVAGAPPSGGWPYGTTLDVSSSPLTLPCVVGFDYTSQGQTLRAATQNETKTPTGDALGMTRRTHMYGAYVINTIGVTIGGTGYGIQFGPDFSNLQPVQFLTSSQNQTPLDIVQMKTGVHQDELNGDYDFEGALAWQISGGYPATVGAVTRFLQTQER